MRGDPYTYPGTDVLRNIFNLRDEAALALADATYTTARLRELMLEPLHGAFDLAHLQAIHRYVFQNLYTWAGELRTVDIRKEDSFFFARPQFIAAAAHATFAQLAAEDRLRGVDHETFVVRAAYYLSEINAIHPFREGNGRTQREFIRELGVARGFTVAWERTTAPQVVAASVSAFQGNLHPLEEMLRGITTSRTD